MRIAIPGSIVSAFAVMLAAGCASSGGTGVPDAPAGNLVLRASGSGSWSIACEATTQKGTAKAKLRGRGSNDYDSMFLKNVIQASCTYEAGDAPFSLSMTEEGLACPFGAFEHELCRTTIPANASGTFEFSPE
ncbi:hypothetical protein [Hyphomonas oceanitis]|uniref:Lipoprotein n=1 Tax=Hyphomonas oceanitis SCH89 TaxID=1280953 RepID=A0A059G2Y5_9PROT|nr:hypothetical protein [Hyphomonas oceanitis]KDA00890.1 hypothetical protein HOC_18209 [Hyphomonas oceanitis SCH89]